MEIKFSITYLHNCVLAQQLSLGWKIKVLASVTRHLDTFSGISIKFTIIIIIYKCRPFSFVHHPQTLILTLIVFTFYFAPLSFLFTTLLYKKKQKEDKKDQCYVRLCKWSKKVQKLRPSLISFWAFFIIINDNNNIMMKTTNLPFCRSCNLILNINF